MKTRLRHLALIGALGLIVAACGGDDASADTTTSSAPTSAAPATTTTTSAPVTTTSAPTTTSTTTTTTAPHQPVLALDTTGWTTLEGGAFYEAWLIVDDAPVSAGAFNVVDDTVVDLDGVALEGLVIDEALLGASAVVISIEPAGDTDPAPADTKFLAGDLTSGTAELTSSHPAALGTDFVDAFGEFVLATPTDGDRVNDEFSGIWFLVFPGPTPGLTLPDLPAGWTYEGWTIIDEIPVTTGTFLDVAASDNEAPFSGTVRTPNFPGEDFLMNAPAGLTFPTDLSGSTVVVSVEPLTETNPAPFSIKPLAGPVPLDAELEPVAYPLTTDGFVPPTAVATLVG